MLYLWGGVFKVPKVRGERLRVLRLVCLTLRRRLLLLLRRVRVWNRTRGRLRKRPELAVASAVGGHVVPPRVFTGVGVSGDIRIPVVFFGTVGISGTAAVCVVSVPGRVDVSIFGTVVVSVPRRVGISVPRRVVIPVIATSPKRPPSAHIPRSDSPELAFVRPGFLSAFADGVVVAQKSHLRLKKEMSVGVWAIREAVCGYWERPLPTRTPFAARSLPDRGRSRL